MSDPIVLESRDRYVTFFLIMYGLVQLSAWPLSLFGDDGWPFLVTVAGYAILLSESLFPVDYSKVGFTGAGIRIVQLLVVVSLVNVLWVSSSLLALLIFVLLMLR